MGHLSPGSCLVGELASRREQCAHKPQCGLRVASLRDGKEPVRLKGRQVILLGLLKQSATNQVASPTALEARCPKLRCQEVHAPCRGSRGEFVPCFPTSRDYLHSLPCGSITQTSASFFTSPPLWDFSVCLFLPVWYKDPCDYIRPMWIVQDKFFLSKSFIISFVIEDAINRFQGFDTYIFIGGKFFGLPQKVRSDREGMRSKKWPADGSGGTVGHHKPLGSFSE